MTDYRVAPRRRTFKSGTIEFSGQILECIVRNLSATGAALEVRSPLRFPDKFVLTIASETLRKPCHIVWRKERHIGVIFEEH